MSNYAERTPIPLAPLERRLLAALVALQYDGCWCDIPMARPLVKEHTKACRQAQAAVGACYLAPDCGS